MNVVPRADLMASMHKTIVRGKDWQLFWPLCLQDCMGETVLI
eukprot:SAG31_NODE_44327_length_263_cov_0.634146_1_plen_41_part_10